MNNDISDFHFRSIGRLAAHKERGSSIISVVEVEKNPHLSNEITDHLSTTTNKVEGNDANDAFEVDLTTSPAINAEWLPLGSTNRYTAPDMYRGEYVILLSMADSKVVYWIDLKTSRKLRRLETATWCFSNVREADEEVNETNSYNFTVSTHDKHITLITNKNDGEPFAYVLQLNTKTGFFTIQDDDGNYILMNSKDRQIRLENKDKSFVDVNKRTIMMDALDLISMKTKDIVMDASNSVKINTKTMTTTSTNCTFSISNTYKVNAMSLQYTGTAVLNGGWQVNGNSHVTGNSYEGSSSGPNNNR